MLRRSLLMLASLAVGTSCSSVAPKTATLLVINETCVPGPCASVLVLLFPSSQPQTPGGLWSIGMGSVTGASACLSFPRSASGWTTWTPDDAASLGILLPGDLRLAASPSTAEFVPASASGWSVTLPGDTAARRAEPCSP
jgi:hypothetical protein